MKIQVSQQMFTGGLAKFQQPMSECGMCAVNKTLKLGEIIIENNGKAYLVKQTEDGKTTIQPYTKYTEHKKTNC